MGAEVCGGECVAEESARLMAAMMQEREEVVWGKMQPPETHPSDPLSPCRWLPTARILFHPVATLTSPIREVFSNRH